MHSFYNPQKNKTSKNAFPETFVKKTSYNVTKPNTFYLLTIKNQAYDIYFLDLSGNSKLKMIRQPTEVKMAGKTASVDL